MKTLHIFLLSLIVISAAGFSRAEEMSALSKHLQDISVTIHSDRSQGSGVIITREVDGEKVNFVWTAGHVVSGLRSVRKVIDPSTGTERQVVEFKDASIVKELIEDGRRVGELKMDAKVIRYSDADNGQDLALLEIRKKDFVQATSKFYLDSEIVPIGTKLFHVGSLLGQTGANSMTTGIVSQVGRILNDKIYDQTTVTAFPGSSGGGVFLADDHPEHAGEYMGMLVRGAGETFNLVVPIRRMINWAREAKVEWALNPEIAVPNGKERAKMPIEDIGVSFKGFSPEKTSDVTAPVIPNGEQNKELMQKLKNIIEKPITLQKNNIANIKIIRAIFGDTCKCGIEKPCNCIDKCECKDKPKINKTQEKLRLQKLLGN